MSFEKPATIYNFTVHNDQSLRTRDYALRNQRLQRLVHLSKMASPQGPEHPRGLEASSRTQDNPRGLEPILEGAL